MPPPAQPAQDPWCGPPRPCQAAGSALGDGVGAALWGLEGGAGKCFPHVGGCGQMAAGLWHPSGRRVGRDPNLAILSLRSTLKAEHTAPSQSHPPGRRGPPHTHCPRPERGFPTPWGSGSQKQLRNQAGNKLQGSCPKATGRLASALDLKLETVGVGITTSGDNPSCHHERQPAPAPRLSPSSWALLLLPRPPGHAHDGHSCRTPTQAGGPPAGEPREQVPMGVWGGSSEHLRGKASPPERRNSWTQAAWTPPSHRKPWAHHKEALLAGIRRTRRPEVPPGVARPQHWAWDVFWKRPAWWNPGPARPAHACRGPAVARVLF